jgi:hypothetical protein
MQDEMSSKPSESKASKPDGVCIKYLKTIWRSVLVFSLIDAMSALIVFLILNIFIRIIFSLTKSVIGITIHQINTAFFILGLIYILSLLITTWWRHISLIMASL